MRRLSAKAKKGKGAANGSGKEPTLEEPETQGNGTEDAGSEDAGKTSRREKKAVQYDVLDSDETGSDDDKPLVSESKKGKKGKKSSAKDGKRMKRESGSEGNEEEEAEEYEVEKVVDSKVIKGIKYYRIRWKGYSEDTDTWEAEGDLNCPDLIKKFLTEQPEQETSGSKLPNKKPLGKKRPSQANSGQKQKKMKVETTEGTEGDEDREYEVDKVLEVHFKKNGEREFLIRWKGFSGDDDTWEPEANLDCPELIEKFMKKVEKAKSVTARELRVNPQVTERFTLTSDQKGRRLSRRHQGRQRATYYNSE